MQSNDLSRTLPLPRRQNHGRTEFAISGFIVAAALIAGVLACLPVLSSSLASASASGMSLTASGTVSNAVLKGDRLAVSPPKHEHRDTSGITTPAAPAKVDGTPKRRFPIGCESAFGALARTGTTAARCVTELAPSTRLGMAIETTGQAARM
jgi:hypothetical protein